MKKLREEMLDTFLGRFPEPPEEKEMVIDKDLAKIAVYKGRLICAETARRVQKVSEGKYQRLNIRDSTGLSNWRKLKEKEFFFGWIKS